jgi:peroxiredoxin Q/BCP
MMAEPPKAGDPAPAFRLPSTQGEVSLDDLRGRRIVLAFYTEDGTPTCSNEISMLKDAYEMLTEFGASVVALSADDLRSHSAFAERIGGLPFPLASDVTLDAARAYGVVDESDPQRSGRAIFVIDRDGAVMLAIPHFQPGNLSQVEAIFAALGAE